MNVSTTASQEDPHAAVEPSGAFVVVWADAGGVSYDIFARRYDQNGLALGSPFRVNATATGAQRRPRVGAGADGELTVVWSSPTPAGDEDVFARRLGETAPSWEARSA